MPLLSLVRLPLPNLRTYAIISTILFVTAIFHAFNWSEEDQASSGYDNAGFDLLDILLVSKSNDKAFMFFRTMVKEPWCLLVLINQAYCCLMLFGKVIQRLVFGQLRIVEQQHAKDKFWNFVFYKFIYIFGVMNVQEMEEIVLWFSWFSVLGFLHILATLSKDRFEYNSSSPSVTRKAHWKVLALLTYLHVTSWMLLLLSVYFWMHYISINTFAFMMAESVMLIIKTLYVLVRYGIHLKDAVHEGAWESRATLVYYSDFVFEVSALFVDFLHHMHMLLYGNIFLSMASLVIGLQLKQLYYELKRRIKRHENYRRVVSSMEIKFPMATMAELKENDDDCAICWEKMDVARKLPCGHMFHNTCLRSWLEQDTTCPTCRLNLRELQVLSSIINHNGAIEVENPGGNFRESVNQAHRPAAARIVQTSTSPIGPQNRRVVGTGRRTSYFHFDGSRILSWLPSFSVEVTQPNLLGGVFGQNSTVDNMVQQVREIFPNYPASIVREDISITRSVEQTIDNIVEGRLVIPEGLTTREELLDSSPGSPTSVDDDDDDDGVTIDGSSDVSNSRRSRNPRDTDISIGVHHLAYQSRDEEDEDDEIIENNNRTGDAIALTSALGKEGSLEDSSLNSISNFLLPLETDLTNPTDEGQVADGIGVGFRFSKSSSEREKMLQLRKKNLIEDARRKYLQKNNLPPVAAKSHSASHKKGLLRGSTQAASDRTWNRADPRVFNQVSLLSQNVRQRPFLRNRTEGSPVDGAESPSDGRHLGFLNE